MGMVSSNAITKLAATLLGPEKIHSILDNSLTNFELGSNHAEMIDLASVHSRGKQERFDVKASFELLMAVKYRLMAAISASKLVIPS